MGVVELGPLAARLVGSPAAGSAGLTTEQRKRLTIGVELVGNPSIVFMDEPTSGEGSVWLWVADALHCLWAVSVHNTTIHTNALHGLNILKSCEHRLCAGLDARAAGVVMRAVRNSVNTGRTVVCTIHQPNREIFEVRLQ